MLLPEGMDTSPQLDKFPNHIYNWRMTEKPNPDAGVQLAQSEIGIPGLVPAKNYGKIIHAETGEVMREEGFAADNLEEKVDELEQALKSRPWLERLRDDVRAGKKTSIVEVVLGGLVLTTAIGAGVELGIRHGKDIHYLYDLVKRNKK
jgi:hypothetical protein